MIISTLRPYSHTTRRQTAVSQPQHWVSANYNIHTLICVKTVDEDNSVFSHRIQRRNRENERKYSLKRRKGNKLRKYAFFLLCVSSLNWHSFSVLLCDMAVREKNENWIFIKIYPMFSFFFYFLLIFRENQDYWVSCYVSGRRWRNILCISPI